MDLSRATSVISNLQPKSDAVLKLHLIQINNVESDLKTEEQLCRNGEGNVHLLVDLDELPKSAVEIMARALYDYYCLD
jgi:hypothetical protein